eukprot:TRINITY_DN6646_c0_g1_i1.p1 TRINITY_DN6646_c0_g1~~TRINITY_DN6646_c0_g1_i1.p1  ORF type:complete len:325 (+),score=81.75 TRINITY_DN6646_c0_g1_i1:481-1455(+)
MAKRVYECSKEDCNLMDLIVILCHQPWLITKNHVASLTKGADSWSMGELVEAILIIATFHSLSGVVFGCGINPELENQDETELSHQPNEEEETVKIDLQSYADNTAKLAELLKSGFQVKETEEQQVHVFASAETIPHHLEKKDNDKLSKTEAHRYCRYLGEFNLEYVDFDCRSKTYSIFKIQDYCWKEDGFELVRRFLPGAATLLDEEFDYIYLMTDNMFNQSTNVDTLPFRIAIWQYIQRVKGMFHDDYNYQQVNMFLNRSTKSFLKKIVCFPETISKSDYSIFGLALRPDEKVHASLLAIESSKQSILLYGVQAIMQHITSV